MDVLQAELLQGKPAAGAAAAGDAGAGSCPAKRRKGHGGKPAAAGDISAFEDALQVCGAGLSTVALLYCIDMANGAAALPDPCFAVQYVSLLWGSL